MMLDWLTPLDYASQQADYLQRRQPGTGRWFLESLKYNLWVKGKDSRTLFCPGIPGVGKTTIACSIINDLLVRFRDLQNVGIAYIYCNYRQQDKQKTYDLLASLLRQLSQARSPLPEIVALLHDKHKHGSTKPSLEEMSEALHSVAALYWDVYIVADALDECETPGTRARFLSELFSLRDRHRVNILVTSRLISEITEQFKSGQFFEISASAEDIYCYLEAQLCKLPPSLIHDTEIRAQIKARIMESAGSIYVDS